MLPYEEGIPNFCYFPYWWRFPQNCHWSFTPVKDIFQLFLLEPENTQTLSVEFHRESKGLLNIVAFLGLCWAVWSYPLRRLVDSTFGVDCHFLSVSMPAFKYYPSLTPTALVLLSSYINTQISRKRSLALRFSKGSDSVWATRALNVYTLLIWAFYTSKSLFFRI